MLDSLAPPFGIYIHWPFCAAKCPYCDFNSHVSKTVDHDRWREAFISELRRVARLTPDHRVRTIFFGGGTPSLMPAWLVAALIDEAQRLWRWENDVEITLEANPTSIEIENFKGFRSAGVNRVSMGVQALDDKDLRRLGRMHSVDDALRGLEVAQSEFSRVSIDLIYARQNQSVANWERELKRAIDLGLDHLSLYQLTVEPGTVFAKRYAHGKLPGLPGEDLAIDLWDITQEITSAVGMPSYEVSNHSKYGAESRHNLIYWTGGDWAGIGPGAHGRISMEGRRHAVETALAPNKWLSSVEEYGCGETVFDVLDSVEIVEELVLMGLRLRDGIDLRRLSHTGWQPPMSAVNELKGLGYITMNQDNLAVTDRGRPLLNSVINRLLT